MPETAACFNDSSTCRHHMIFREILDIEIIALPISGEIIGAEHLRAIRVKISVLRMTNSAAIVARRDVWPV